MKKIIVLAALALVAPAFAAPLQTCNAAKQPLLSEMAAELNRSFKVLKKQRPPVYYMSYQLEQSDSYRISASLGGLAQERKGRKATADVMVRVGGPKLDNTHELKGAYADGTVVSYRVPLEETDSLALKNVLWRATQEAAERAQNEFNTVESNVKTLAESADKSNDFTLPQKSLFCQLGPDLSVNGDKMKQLLLNASKLVEGHGFILQSSFDFIADQRRKFFTDSVGTRLATESTQIRISISVSARNKDGMDLSRYVTFDGFSEEDLPSEEAVLAATRQAISELQALQSAPVVEPFIGPVLLKNRATGVFVHEILGHRVEGNRQKSESFGQTFTKKLGEQVVSPILTISDDPTLSHFNGQPLRGFYLYDDEGVKAQPVNIIEKGVLKGFLMSSSPIEGFPLSNGHGRKEMGQKAFSRMGTTMVRAENPLSYEQLEAKLIEEIKRQNKPYGLIIDDISGGFTMTERYMPQSFKVNPLLVWRVYPDGRKEVVRGADMVGTPLTSFNKVIAAADDYAVFNGSCGAESGWVPVSAVAPSILVSEMEIEKVNKSDYKPPLLPAPYATGKGGN